MTEELTYSQMLTELEAIVDAVSRDDCPVDELEHKVYRAGQLIKTLKERLKKTGKSVSEMLTEIDN
ncbi:exodeoxyribonuclease VII small subunit [Candidatus Fermentibacteria bacterium]|jgi:exodeoxyribonuclease VII small subunit|nr:MAG: exodeoxyribonuclease VII small subunit [Candidatus Fermentibacteria bacterium]